jgi:flagellar hook assembly protein FlgD
VALRAISGHRDTGYTSCPGNILYNALPSIATEVARTGLPKLYDPVVRGGVGGPVSFTARLSAPATWRVSVRDASGIVVSTGSGIGQNVAWTWDATLVPRGAYRWTIEAGAATRPAAGRIGTGTLTSPPPAPVAPVSDLVVEPPLISPNGDGFADAATISYVVKTKSAVTALVRNVEAVVVTTLFAEQQQSAKQQSFLWSADGLPDGQYVFEVSATTADGRTELLEDDVVVDRTLSGVVVTPAVVSPNGDGRDDAAVIGFTLAAPTPVTVQIEQAGVAVAVPYSGLLEAGTHQVTWDGNVPDGPYDAVVIAQTPLAAVRQGVPLTVNRAA